MGVGDSWVGPATGDKIFRQFSGFWLLRWGCWVVEARQPTLCQPSPLHTLPSSPWPDNTRKPHYFTSFWSVLDNFISLCFSLKQLYGVCLSILLWLKVLYCYCLYKVSETDFPKEFRAREEIVFLITSSALFIRFVKKLHGVTSAWAARRLSEPGFQQRCCTQDFLENLYASSQFQTPSVF